MIDVGYHALRDDARLQAKGGFTLIQFLASGVPGIASQVGVNSEIVKHGVSGFLAASEDQWPNALCQLIGNASLRNTFATQGQELVKGKYDISVGTKLLTDALEGIGCHAGLERIELEFTFGPPFEAEFRQGWCQWLSSILTGLTRPKETLRRSGATPLWAG